MLLRCELKLTPHWRASSSTAISPMLCRVASYFDPGLPSPTTNQVSLMLLPWQYLRTVPLRALIGCRCCANALLIMCCAQARRPGSNCTAQLQRLKIKRDRETVRSPRRQTQRGLLESMSQITRLLLQLPLLLPSRHPSQGLPRALRAPLGRPRALRQRQA